MYKNVPDKMLEIDFKIYDIDRVILPNPIVYIMDLIGGKLLVDDCLRLDLENIKYPKKLYINFYYDENNIYNELSRRIIKIDALNITKHQSTDILPETENVDEPKLTKEQNFDNYMEDGVVFFPSNIIEINFELIEEYIGKYELIPEHIKKEYFINYF